MSEQGKFATDFQTPDFTDILLWNYIYWQIIYWTKNRIICMKTCDMLYVYITVRNMVYFFSCYDLSSYVLKLSKH